MSEATRSVRGVAWGQSFVEISYMCVFHVSLCTNRLNVHVHIHVPMLYNSICATIRGCIKGTETPPNFIHSRLGS